MTPLEPEVSGEPEASEEPKTSDETKALSKSKPKPLAKPKPPNPQPLVVESARQFRRDIKLLGKRGKSMGKLKRVVDAIRAHQRLDVKHQDHPLVGVWKGWRDCHIEPDWVLIYKVEHGVLRLGRTGTHSDLFR